MEHDDFVMPIISRGVNQEIIHMDLDFMGEVWTEERNSGVITKGDVQVVFKVTRLAYIIQEQM